ncbi:MAG: hypothetical protein HDT15_03530 [Oscillibacter sp.]|nr:hypothetical protein [Oscillibacter sp.]
MEEMFIEIERIANTAANTIATPNWADKLSLIISVVTAIIATIVAWRQIEITAMQNKIVLKQTEISEQQNKIALFEKRYEVYRTVKKVLNVADEIHKVTCIEDVYDIFYNNFKDWQWPRKEDRDADRLWMPACVEILNSLEQARFLFSQDVYEEISHLKLRFMVMLSIVYVKSGSGEFDEDKVKFYQSAEYFKTQKVIERIESDLQLRSIKIQE